jgi:hypothetical protein
MILLFTFHPKSIIGGPEERKKERQSGGNTLWNEIYGENPAPQQMAASPGAWPETLQKVTHTVLDPFAFWLGRRVQSFPMAPSIFL